MSKIIYSHLILLAALSVGCSKSSDSPAPAQPAVPAQLSLETYQRMKQPVLLSASSKAQISAFAKSNRSKLPSASLFFDAENGSTDNDQRSKDTAILDADGTAALAKIKANCTIDPGAESSTGTTQVGTASTSSRTKKVSGANCPISYNESTSSTWLISAMDANTAVMTGKTSTKSSTSLQVLDQDLLTLSQTGGYSIEMDAAGAMENYSSDMQGSVKTGGLYMNATMSGSITIAGAKYPVSGVMEMLQRPNQKDTQLLMTISIPNGNFILGFSSRGGKKEIFVNGQPYSEDQLKNEFGIDGMGM